MTRKAMHRRQKADRFVAPDRVSVQNAITIDHIVGVYARRKAAADQKWGTDRLPEIVGPALAQKYGRAVETFEQSMLKETPDPDEVRGRVENLVKGLNALDAEAERIGAGRAPDECIAITVNDKPAAIVYDGASVGEVARLMPHAAIYTIEEIERILSHNALRLVTSAKEHFPGAEIVDIRPRPPAVELDDEIPF